LETISIWLSIKLHNEGLYNLHSSPSVIKTDGQMKEEEIGRECSTNEEKSIVYRVFKGSQKEGDHYEGPDIGG
jgi:hypothetical protein